MNRTLTLVAVALLVLGASALPLQAAGLTGHYLEARTCDIWTGPCFANAEFNITGKNAVMVWKVNQGSLDNVKLDGLGVVAVVVATDTLGLKQTGPARAVLLVDEKATAAQREALVRLARQQGGELLGNVVAVRSAPINLNICPCKSNSCVEFSAGSATLKTRCLDDNHDKVCGNEYAFHPPLARNVEARPAACVEHGYAGTGLGETWRDFDRRSAYVGTFSIK